MPVQTFDFNPIYYNEVIFVVESKWEMKLSDHTKHLLIEGYRFGRSYNSGTEFDVVQYLESKWQRGLFPHEIGILMEGFNFGKTYESKEGEIIAN